MVNPTKTSSFHPLPDNLCIYKNYHTSLLAPRTRTNYLAQWNRMLARFPDGKTADRVHLIYKDLTERADLGQIRPATYRQHKASALFGLSTLISAFNLLEPEFDDGSVSLEFYEDIYKLFLNHRVNGGADNAEIDINQPLRTSAKKLKEFPKEIFEWIQNQNSDNRPSLKLLQLFLRANIRLGLRPSEWCDVQFANNRNSRDSVLVVRNFKNSFGRANGSHRLLVLSGITSQERADIIEFKRAFEYELKVAFQAYEAECDALQMKDPFSESNLQALKLMKLEKVAAEGKIWNSTIANVPLDQIVDKYGNIQHEFAHRKMANLQRVLYLELKKCPLFKSDSELRPTLYATRHQAIADAKKSKIPVLEVAAFFGHASVSTASTHYAKAGAGWSKFKFTPDPDCVALVHVAQSKGLDTTLKGEQPRPKADGEEFDYDW